MIRLPQSNSVDGVLLIDKAADWTSFDVIRFLRGRFHIAKIGHAGTLDPFATGLLVVVLGKATKLSQQLMSSKKTYEGSLKLGEETDTYDKEGTITAQAPVDGIQIEHLREAMKSFLGDQYQMPPMFSAKKIHGVPLYKLARKGQEVERQPNFITVFDFQCLDYTAPVVNFKVQCSKGTYVRALAFDLGRKLGCGAHLTSLRRTQSGSFSIEQAVSLDLLRDESVKSLQPYLIPYEQLAL